MSIQRSQLHCLSSVRGAASSHHVFWSYSSLKSAVQSFWKTYKLEIPVTWHYFVLLFFPGESKVDKMSAKLCSPPPSSSSSSSSVTTQPIPRTDLFPPPPTAASPAAPASRPPTPPPEPEQPLPSLSKEEEGDAQGASELKHRTPKEDLLEIDRFTICGNRIDWAAAAASVAINHSGKTARRGLCWPTAAECWVFIKVVAIQ